MPDPRLIKNQTQRIAWTVAMVAACASAHAGTPRAAFFRGINLNGSPVVIDDHQWEGGDSKNLESCDLAFEDSTVPLVPLTDPERARMIRSSRWNGHAALRFTNVPRGMYSVFVDVWEDNNSETFSIALDGREVVLDFASGPAG